MTDANTHVVRALCHVNSSNPHETRHARIQTQLARVCEKEGERGRKRIRRARDGGGTGGHGVTREREDPFYREYIL